MTVKGHASLTLEQSALVSLRRGEPEMSVAAAVKAAPPCGAGDEAELNEEGLDYILDGVARLGKACSKRLHPDRAAAVEVCDHRQVAPVHRVEAEAVDLEPRQRLVGDLGRDGVGACRMGEIADAAKQAAGDPRSSARAARDFVPPVTRKVDVQQSG